LTHYADHGMWHTINDEHSPQNLTVSAELVSPEPVRYDCHAPSTLFYGIKGVADLGWGVEYLEESWTYVRGDDKFRICSATYG